MSNTKGARLLDQAIRAAGDTRRRAEEKLSLADGAITRICEGQRGVSVRTALRCRDVYRVPIDAWIEASGAEVPSSAGAAVLDDAPAYISPEHPEVVGTPVPPIDGGEDEPSVGTRFVELDDVLPFGSADGEG